MKVTSVESMAEYVDFSESMAEVYESRRDKEIALITNGVTFETGGYCFVCSSESTFQTDYLYSDPGNVVGDKRIPNWRERLVCSRCNLNNRTRASIQFMEESLNARPGDKIYVTEQTTQLYAYLHNKYAGLQGSEFLGDKVPLGQRDATTGLRNESLTGLTFDSDFFDLILSFDVFEHIPEYRLAWAECLRCLKPEGTLLFTVPFNKFAKSNLVRAKIDRNGDIEHILEPEYHGDPINPEGSLCFYHFGWEMLEQMRQTGFSTVKAHLFWSEELGYLGDEQILFSAHK